MKIEVENNQLLVKESKTKSELKAEYTNLLEEFNDTLEELYPQAHILDNLKKNITLALQTKLEYENKIKEIENKLSILNKDLAYYSKEDKVNLLVKYVDSLFANFDYIIKGDYAFIKSTGLIWLKMNGGNNIDYYSRALDYVNNNFKNFPNYELPTQSEVTVFNKNLPSSFPSYYQYFWKGMTIGVSGDSYFDCSGNYDYVYMAAVNREFSKMIADIDIEKNPEEYAAKLIIFLENESFIDPEDEILAIAETYLRKSDLEKKILKLQSEFKGNIKTAKNFKKSSVSNVNEESKVVYCQNLISLFNEYLEELDEYKENEAELLLLASTIASKINNSVTETDSDVLQKRTNLLKLMLDFSGINLYSQIIALKKESEDLNNELIQADTMAKLYAFEQKQLPSFSLIAEKTEKIVNDQLERMEWLRDNSEICNNLVKLHLNWRDNYREFLNVTVNYFYDKCKKNSVDKTEYEHWFSQWEKERALIEQHIEPLIKAGLDGIITLDSVLEVADKMKTNLVDKINQFYFEDMIPLHQKYSFDGLAGKLHEKLEKETELQNILSGFLASIEKVIFSLETSEGRLFLLRWAQDWYDSQIIEIIEFTKNTEFCDIIAVETLQKFRELNNKNLESAIKDGKTYIEAAQKRNEEFNALLFKMRKEAETKNKKKQIK